jgi:dTMP kinase
MEWKRRQAGQGGRGARTGIFIVFEGVDGSGKSTQARLLAQRLERAGRSALLTAEPSSGPVGLYIRSLKQRPPAGEEARLFAEDRRDHVKRVIEPALEEGLVVICDRYVYSSMAYQGARGMDLRAIEGMNMKFAIAPDIIIFLELPVDAAQERISRGRSVGPTIYEMRENLEAVDRVYRGLSDPLIKRIDALGAVERVHAAVVEELIAFEAVGDLSALKDERWETLG